MAKPGAIRTEVGYLKLGELEVAIIPGEIYPELVLGKVQDPSIRGPISRMRRSSHRSTAN